MEKCYVKIVADPRKSLVAKEEINFKKSKDLSVTWIVENAR